MSQTNEEKTSPSGSQTERDPEQAGSDSATEILPPQLSAVLRSAGINPDDPNITRALEISLSLFRGPLPLVPPPILKDYQDIDPHLVEKLIQWTEAQADHRRHLERERTARSERRHDRGQFIVLAVALGGLSLSAVVGIFGSSLAAAAIAIVSVGGPTAAIALAKMQKN